MPKREYIIDGANFSTLEEFWEEIDNKLMLTEYWGKNLDAFNDVVRGGFGTPDEGFVLIWKNSDLSREKLGYSETLRQLQIRLLECHPVNREVVKMEIEQAKRNEGKTVFDWLLRCIEFGSPKGVELRLE